MLVASLLVRSSAQDDSPPSPPSTLKKSTPPPTSPLCTPPPSHVAGKTVDSVNKILKDYGFGEIGREGDIEGKFVEILDVVKRRGEVREAGGAKRRLLDFNFLRTRYARPVTNKSSHAPPPPPPRQ